MIKYRFNDTGCDSIVRLLIENGANINTANDYNNTALIVAISRGSLIIIKQLNCIKKDTLIRTMESFKDTTKLQIYSFKMEPMSMSMLWGSTVVQLNDWK